MTTTATARILSISLVLSAGCAAIDDGDDQPADIGEATAPLYTLSSAIWPTRDIPVCFESYSPGTSWARTTVRDAIEDSWERVADVDFIGWNTCNSSSRGIRIQWDDSNPNVSQLGRYLDGVEGGMTLDEDFVEWNSSGCANSKTFCVRAIAIHEFGHALGFSHEQNRPDTPSSCTDAPQGEDGDTLTTVYDPDSVMNYCAPYLDRLSKLDVTGVRRVYHKKPQDSLVSNGGKCLTTATGSGSWMLTDGCEPILGQSFEYLRASKQLENGAGQCVDTYGTSYSMYGGGCYNDTYQQFTFDGNELRGYGDLCLDVAWGLTATPGTAVLGYGCTSSTMNYLMSNAEKWILSAARELRTVGGLCLTADGTANYADATIRTCTGGSNQKWTLDDGLIRSDTGRCLIFSTSNGDAFMYDCASLSTERAWHLAGPIHTRGLCVAVNGASDDGRTVFPTSCGTSDRQMFDFYF